MVIDLGGYQVPVAWLLAVVTALAYVLGRCGRRPVLFSDQQVLELERELRRAQAAAVKLEQIVRTTRASLDKHQYRLKRFKKRVARLSGQPQDEIWQKLSREIEDILSPTVHLAAQIASVHDVIRYESSLLMTLTDSRRDALTGICNRRGLDRALSAQLAVMDRYGSPCSLLLLDIDSFKDVNDRQGHLCGDQILCDLARLLEEEAREVDVLARYGGDEFTIVMTQTGLDGALVLAERVRRKVEPDHVGYGQRRRDGGQEKRYAGRVVPPSRHRPLSARYPAAIACSSTTAPTPSRCRAMSHRPTHRRLRSPAS